jgi:hypothetical protein
MDYQTAQFISSQAPGPCLFRFVNDYGGNPVFASLGVFPIPEWYR